MGRNETFGGMKWASKLRDTSKSRAIGKSYLLGRGGGGGMTENSNSLDPQGSSFG